MVGVKAVGVKVGDCVGALELTKGSRHSTNPLLPHAKAALTQV
jgi:hypothetical protein